jgi:hypothetical protein
VEQRKVHATRGQNEGVCVCVYPEEGEGGTEEGACDERVE